MGHRLVVEGEGLTGVPDFTLVDRWSADRWSGASSSSCAGDGHDKPDAVTGQRLTCGCS